MKKFNQDKANVHTLGRSKSVGDFGRISRDFNIVEKLEHEEVFFNLPDT